MGITVSCLSFWFHNSQSKGSKQQKIQHLLTRLLRRESELLPPHNRIEKRRLPNIRSPNQHKLRKSIGRAVLSPRAALHELRRRDLRVPSVGPEHDVRALQNPRPHRGRRGTGKVDLGRDEEPLDGDPDLGFVGDWGLRNRDRDGELRFRKFRVFWRLKRREWRKRDRGEVGIARNDGRGEGWAAFFSASGKERERLFARVWRG